MFEVLGTEASAGYGRGYGQDGQCLVLLVILGNPKKGAPGGLSLGLLVLRWPRHYIEDRRPHQWKDGSDRHSIHLAVPPSGPGL